MEESTQPQPVGLTKSFGYGDRLGRATPGHLAAGKRSRFIPVFAQQSIREMTRAQRTPEEVMEAARSALTHAGYNGVWGADADHLKSQEDVEATAKAGFRCFTIDPSAHVNNQVDQMDSDALEQAARQMEADGTFDGPDWRDHYLNHSFDIAEGLTLQFDRESLLRAASKYGRAMAFTAEMGRHIAKANPNRPFEIEVSVDETDSPTSALDHLFIGEELKRRQVPSVVSLAPRFVGEFEKGVDYVGDLQAFEKCLREHVAIARYCGPYKISVHSGSDKFSIYPIIGRVCRELLHVKTAGTSYLEALRVMARIAPASFGEVASFARERFDSDRKSYHISTGLTDIEALPAFTGPAEEPAYFETSAGRQLLHVTFGSVLTVGKDRNGRPFKEILLELLDRNGSLHHELLERHFTRHLELLEKG